MRDLKPEDAYKKEVLSDIFRAIAKRFGFVPLETPCVEMYSTLAAKGAVKDEIYYFRDKSNRELGLRFDLTVPLARFVASNLNLKLPFRRYQIGEVFRYDRPQKGRYREFTQADIDIVGFKDSFLASYEILSFALSFLDETGIDAKIRVSDRRIVEDFLRKKGISDKIDKAFIIIDKLPKIGLDNAKAMFKEEGFNPELLDTFYYNKIEEIKEVCDKSMVSFLEELVSSFKDNRIVIDFSIVRGLGYYTGIVLEVDAGQIIGGGGQYSNLVSAFSSKTLDAIGMSFGLDRVIEYFNLKSKTKKCFMYFFDNCRIFALEIASKLRKFGIPVVFDLNNKSFGSCLNDAVKDSFDYFLIIGEDEVKDYSLTIKNLKTKEQKTFSLSEFSKILEELK